MRGRAASAVLLALASCASEPAIVEPIWSGPPIAARSLDSGAMALTIVAPTANHELEVVGVERVGETAEVTVRYTTPGDMLTAQVLTQVTAEVAAAQLGECSRVRFWVAERARGSTGAEAEPVLSVVQRR